MVIPYDILGTITGVLGALTGIVSLLWHLHNSRSKVIFERVYYEKGGFLGATPRGYVTVGVDALIRNKGDKSTTLEKIFVDLRDIRKKQIIVPEIPISDKLEQIIVPANSSKEVKFTVCFDEKNYKRLMSLGKVRFTTEIDHTFGILKKVSNPTEFSTGYLTVE